MLVFQAASFLSPLIQFVLMFTFNFQRLILFLLIPDSGRLPCVVPRGETQGPQCSWLLIISSAIEAVMLQGRPVLVSAPICVRCPSLRCFEPGWKWRLPPWRHSSFSGSLHDSVYALPLSAAQVCVLKHILHQSHKSVLLGNANDREESKLSSSTLATTLIVAF